MADGRRPAAPVLAFDPDLPLALAELHAATAEGARLALTVTDVPGAGGPQPSLEDLLIGAGFGDAVVRAGRGGHGVEAVRARSLPDFVGPGLRALVCGLNPSLHAADAGVGFVTPSNRFWTAATEADLVTKVRDPWHVVGVDRVGMTDLVKRATPRADGLTRAEYRTGFGRLERLCGWLRPGVVVFVGLAGWRAAVDPRATAGLQETTVGGSRAYVLPSTSGLNAATPRAALVDHLRAALTVAAG